MICARARDNIVLSLNCELLFKAMFCSLLVAIFSFLQFAGAHAGPNEKAKSSLERPMQFVIVRSNAAYCEPTCPEWIYAEGQIVDETPMAFRAIMKKAGSRKLPLVIASPGGNVDAAIVIGRLIRKNGMDVEIGYTNFNKCRPSEKGCEGDGAKEGEYLGSVFVGGAFCWSACPLILASGEKRFSSQWSFTGVHQVTTVYQKEKVYYRERFHMVDGKKKVISRKVIRRKSAGLKSTTKLPKNTRRLLVGYLTEMGVDKSMLDAMLSTPPERIRILKPVEMLNMNLISELSSTEVLTDPALCKATSPAKNCIFRQPTSLTTLSPVKPPSAPQQ